MSTRPIRFLKHKDALLPPDQVMMVSDLATMKEYLPTLIPAKRQKLVAFLCTMYTPSELVTALGLSINYINMSKKNYRDIIDAAQVARVVGISGLAERRVIELLRKMDVDKISEDKKPQAIKNLMDATEIAGRVARPQKEDKQENIMELIFRIKQGSRQPDEKTIDAEEDEETLSDESEEPENNLLPEHGEDMEECAETEPESEPECELDDANVTGVEDSEKDE
jgi:hypothetical protein